MAALGAATLLPASSADAALLVDLRFSDGTKSKVAAPGTYSVDVWAQVTGANAVSDEGLTYLYGSLQSQQVNGGAIGDGPLAGIPGVTGNTATGPVFTVENPRGQAGTGQNLTADGVQDWGTVATNATTTIKYNSALAADGSTPAFIDTPGVVANAITNGVEFKVGTLTVTIGSDDVNLSGTGETRFNWVKGTGAFPTPHSHRIDGGTAAVTSAATYTTPGAANGVAFTAVPEPTTLGVLGVATLGLLGRRQRRGR